MRQRALIAMSLAGRPRLLIADEPTAALDAVVQREIIALIDRLRRDFGMAVLLITHNLAHVEDIADSVLVMRAGTIVERGSREDISPTRGTPTHVNCLLRHSVFGPSRRRLE
jgi:ABC-type dipeptide/oligopeptide/nickel transport system ATPase component